ncbi:acyltransferase family protein [Burkholderia gladioli]|uniref:acyltransferase family protein n=1 Tax=Burkholderia gladioli TaxID=28095 RepID=UPI001640A10A|nr:acyltransferase [Burkholderia gladioli]
MEAPAAAHARALDNFDAIRLIAALVVLYGHAYPLTGSELPPMFGNEVATLAVKVFFAISGYLVIESWRRDPSPSRYLQRRMLRIFPGLAVAVLLSTFVLGPLVSTLPLGDYLRSPLLPRYLQNIVLRSASLLPGVFHTLPYPDAVNGSLWTLPIEFGMYLVTPLLVLRGAGQKLRILAGCLALCAASLVLLRIERLELPGHGRALLDALNVAPYFLIGAAWRIAAPARLFNVQAALFALPLPMLVPGNGAAYELSLYLVLPYAILSLAQAKPACLGWAGRFGDFSYGVYIYAFPVQQTVALCFHTDRHPLLNAALSIPPVVLLAALSWHGVEKRFLHLKPRGSSTLREASRAKPVAG